MTMSKSEIILQWLFDQVIARNIKPAAAARLVSHVDMSDASEEAKEIKSHLESATDFRYIFVGRRTDARGISTQYDGSIMGKAISKILTAINRPGPTELARNAVLLIASGILENDITKAQARRLLLSLDQEREKAWGGQSAFNSAFDKWQADIGSADILLYKEPILRIYTIIRDTN